MRAAELATPVHALSLERSVGLVVEVVFKIELGDVADDHLVSRVEAAFFRDGSRVWNDDQSAGMVRPVNWPLVRTVMEQDDVYFGGSRMIELLAGGYTDLAEHDLSARWRPVEGRNGFASAVYHASLVSWATRSPDAIRKKARHFRKLLADAEGQLPPDRPGVIHVGVESRLGKGIDVNRHLRNWIEASSFAPTSSRLCWAYGHYFVPEPTTDPNETWALTETVVPYRIGQHRTRWPLPDMLLAVPRDAIVPGGHWDRTA